MLDIKRNIFLLFAAALLGVVLAQFVDPKFYFPEYQTVVHTFLEFLSIYMTISIFAIAWLMRAGLKDKPSRFVLFFSLIFLAVGMVDFLHSLAYEGIPNFFSPHSSHKALFLWLLGRYLIILSFLASFLSEKLSEKRRLTVVAITAFILAIVLPTFLLSIFFLHYVPPFTENLNTLTLWLEYLLIVLYFAGFYCLWRRKSFFKTTIFLQLCYFLVFSLLSESIFIIYSYPSNIYNLLGHIYKVLAYYFLYRAVGLSGIADYFYTLSEMAKMSAKQLNSKADVQQIVEIQVEKLNELVPQAERIVFYLHEEHFVFRLINSWGKFNHLTPNNLTLQLEDFCTKCGENICVSDEFPRKLSILPPEEIPEQLSDALGLVHHCMYIPLTSDGAFLGIMVLYIFNPLRLFSARDIEKATVFQQFASLSLAQVRHHEIIRKLSYEDSLTGLPNRRAFFEMLKKAEYDLARYQIPYTVVSLDMNDLKYINDTWGHAVGDQALKLIGQTLSQSVRQNDFAARLGGDEFGILFSHMNFKNGLEKIAELKKTFSYLTLPEYNHTFSISVGGASSPEEAANANILLNLADERMYAHKHEYKSDSLI